MFRKKLFAFVTTLSYATWVPIWCGDSLNQLSKVDFDYFKSFYGLENLSFSSEYVFDDDDFHFDDDFFEDL